MNLLKRIVSVAVMERFTLEVKFTTGERKEIFFKELIEWNKCFSALQDDINYFNQVKISKGGFGLYWDENLEVSAEFLYDNGSLICPFVGTPEYNEKEKAIYEIVVNSNIKIKAEEYMKSMGLDFNTAVTLFIYQVYYTKSIPFPIKLPDWLK